MGLNICSRVKLLTTKFNLEVFYMRKKTGVRPKLTCLVKILIVVSQFIITKCKLICPKVMDYWNFHKRELMIKLIRVQCKVQ